MSEAAYSPPFEGQAFATRQQWVNKASSWLTCHPEYNNTEHHPEHGWRGHHFTAMCFDAKGRRVRTGGDFHKAQEEEAFPVWWVWPDQIPDLVAALAAKEEENMSLRNAMNRIKPWLADALSDAEMSDAAAADLAFVNGVLATSNSRDAAREKATSELTAVPRALVDN